MATSFKKEFEKLEAQRESVFELLKGMDDNTLNKIPSPGAWSVATVIRHLIAAESMSLQYLRKKTQDTSRSAGTGVKHELKMLQVKAVFAFDIKFKAPDLVNPEVKFETAAELRNEWAALRNETAQLLEKLSEEELKKEIWKHAIAGKLNAHQMLRFFGLHTGRHISQIKKTLRKVSDTH